MLPMQYLESCVFLEVDIKRLFSMCHGFNRHTLRVEAVDHPVVVYQYFSKVLVANFWDYTAGTREP